MDELFRTHAWAAGTETTAGNQWTKSVRRTDAARVTVHSIYLLYPSRVGNTRIAFGTNKQLFRRLAGFNYQLPRLAALTTMGGDDGSREDWVRIQHEIAKASGTLKEVPRVRRHFWTTDGTLFEPSEGRDAPRELLERVLEYAPDATVGSSYSYPPQP